jgi:GntR family transcriptional regulator
VIEFRLNERSGVPTYLQLVHQVRQAVRLGLLQPGDQLPTVKDVVGRLAINPNTVLKAYRELDHEGLVEARRGQGTYVSRRITPSEPAEHAALQSALLRWIERAQAAGFDEDGVAALFAAAARAAFVEDEVA